MLRHLIVWLLFAGVAVPAWGIGEADRQFFENRIRPIFAEHCYSCHGVERQRAELRVDHITPLLQGGENGPAFQPGDPEGSLLLRAVRYGDVHLQMPPSGKLPEQAIADIEAWITMGAPWPDEPFQEGYREEEPFDLDGRREAHWSWQPMARPEVPAAGDGWARTDIDRFLAAGHERQDFVPAPEADRATLLRRLYFDLVGLPPSPESIEAFVADTSPDAYEKQVDALLASPHFGERWGRHWLDLTRYAETFGHEGDYTIHHAWRYRDYVIRAFNNDIPYDRMIQEHIAGDLPAFGRTDPDTGINEAVLATGFWYMHQATHGPVDVWLDHAERIDNQIDVMSKAFLAMTVSCARCHDHKFDAVSIEDYYALSGILRSSRPREALLDIHGAIAAGAETLLGEAPRGERLIAQAAARVDQEQRIRDYILAADAVERGADRADTAKAWGLDEDRLGAWAEAVGELSPETPRHPLALWGERTGRLGDSTAFLMEEQPPLAAASEEQGADWVVFTRFDEVLTDWQFEGEAFGDGPTAKPTWVPGSDGPRLVPAGVVHSGLAGDALEGSLRSPVFTLEHDHIHIRAAGRYSDVRLIIENYTLRDQNGLLFGGAGARVDHGDHFEWVTMRRDLTKFLGARAYLEFRDHGAGYIAVDEIRFSNDRLPDSERSIPAAAGAPAGLPETAAHLEAGFIAAAESWSQGAATLDSAARLGFLLRHDLVGGTSAALRLRNHSQDLARRAAELPKPARATAIAEGTPEDQPVFIRGNHRSHGDLVARRFLEAIDDPGLRFDEGSGRGALALALTDPENPLTARVVVNRVWHHLFGRGIVPSVDDFGDMGEPPSHPELLDFLARRFTEEGWSVKALIRDLATSSAYRMASTPTADQDERDPANVWLHRMPRKRLEAEAIRDAILAAAGTLDSLRYGPSVSAWISPYMTGVRAPEHSGPLDGDRRRSIYLEVRRNYLSPMLTTFDFPLPDTTHGNRNVSNVPAQALILMNDPFVVEQAEAWAARLLEEQADAEGRIDRAYREALGRPPDDAEMARARAFLANHGAALGVSGEDKDGSVALWSDFCHVLFMSKEFIFIG